MESQPAVMGSEPVTVNGLPGGTASVRDGVGKPAAASMAPVVWVGPTTTTAAASKTGSGAEPAGWFVVPLAGPAEDDEIAEQTAVLEALFGGELAEMEGQNVKPGLAADGRLTRRAGLVSSEAGAEEGVAGLAGGLGLDDLAAAGAVVFGLLGAGEPGRRQRTGQASFARRNAARSAGL